MLGSAASAAIRSSRERWSIIGWARPWVRRSSPKSIMVWPSARRSSGSAQSGCRGMLDRIGPSSSAAITMASSQRVPPANNPRRDPAPAAVAGAACGAAGGSQVCSWGQLPPRVSTARRAASVRSGCPAPRKASCTGVASPSAYALISSATSLAGGLDTTMTSSVAGSSASMARACRVDRPPTAAERSRPPTPRQ